MPFCKKCTLSTLFLLFIFNGFYTIAQTNNPLINSGEIIQKGSKLHDEKKYKEAISEFKKIDRSDTNYVNALYEMSYSYYSDSQFDKSLEYAKLGMGLFPHKYSLFSMQAANSLDDLNKPEEAISIYDSSIKINPQSYLLFFNKGIVNYKLKKYDVAKINMQQCLLINPFYSSAHYFLGYINLIQGNLVAALLAFKTYLLIAPEGKYSMNTITAMGNISKVTDDVLEYVKNKPASKEDDFTLQQEILLSKVALDKKYKLKADLEDNIVRQIQVVDEKLEYNKNDKGFCMQYYLPLYANTIKDGGFEAMIFTMFSGLNNKQIENWNKKNKKEKQVFIDKASAYLDAIKTTRILDPEQRNNSKLTYLYNNKSLIGKGQYSTGKDPFSIGNWEYYYDNGSIKAKGKFNDAGEKEGTWSYYYETGQLKEVSVNINGVLNGLAEGWFNNGNKWYAENYINGKISGIQTIYYFNELRRSITVLKESLKNGEEKLYNNKGQLSSISNYVDDKLEGISKSFYPDGKLKNEYINKNGLVEGTYKSYYKSGGLYIKGEFKNDLRQGLWTTYFEDGIVSEKTVYLDNEITGEFTEYFSNGTLSRKGTYYKKKIDGKMESYDDDGKIFMDAVYDRGKLKEVNFYDKEGKNFSNITTRKGAANIIFYTAEGIKSSEGFFNKDGNKEGKFVTYYNSGKISEESYWKAGVKNGAQISYYPNSKIKRITNFKDGEEDGYVKNFYQNEVISSEGWRTEGNRQQGFLYYNNLGDLTTREYFLNDELDGYADYYDRGNIHSLEYYYHNGWLENIKQFDSTGKIISENKFEKGHGPLIFKYPNGKNSTVGNYDHYMLNGPYTYYFFDGSISATRFYKNDQSDSIYKGYYYGGVLRTEGKFKNGLKEGPWKYYYANGKLREEENYVDDNLEGVNKMYKPDGSIDRISNYKNNELDGAYDIYSEKNQLAVRLNYKEDIIKSYQYEEKPAVMSAPIKLKGSSGQVLAKYPNGKPSAQFTFVENVLDGERKLFYANGNIFVDGKRDNGYNNGLYKSFYPNGNPWKVENYIQGNLHGLCTYYYPNGKIEKEENYYNNELHGVNKYYDEQGKLKSTHIYYYDLLLSVK